MTTAPLPGGISPRQVMAKNLSTAKAFVQNFPDGGRSLLMTGPSGLGKTHLSSAIGGELAARGYHVVYEMAPTLLQKLEDVKFGRRAPRGGVSKLRPAHCGRPGQRIHHRLFHCRPLCPFGRAAGARQAGASSAPISRPMSSSKTTPKNWPPACATTMRPSFSWGRMCAGQSGRLSSVRRARRRQHPLPKNKGRRSALFCPPPPLFSHAFWRCFPWIVQSPLFLSSFGAPFASAPSPSAAATP